MRKSKFSCFFYLKNIPQNLLLIFSFLMFSFNISCFNTFYLHLKQKISVEFSKKTKYYETSIKRIA